MGDLKALNQYRQILKQNMPMLSTRYGVESLAMFGSQTRGTQHESSDLDLLVTFSSLPSLLKFIELENFLSDLLGLKVDLVIPETLKPRIGQRIMNEAVLV